MKVYSDSAATQPPNTRCPVSVIIKALNEEKRITTTIESALRAVNAFGGEVVLADSCSTDRTVELAQQYPIRIVQLLHPEERCCGVGPQLGYQHSKGDFVYILDGDMELRPGALEKSMDFLSSNPKVAGVAGRVVEHNLQSLEYIARNQNKTRDLEPKSVDRLDGGGLYRRECIEDAGYFSDRNLHSYEEVDLAIRLRSRGWELWRLPVDAVNHWGHDSPPYQLLMDRWKTGYICGLGELVRAAAGKPRLKMVIGGLGELRLYLAVLVWWILLLSIVFWPVQPGARALTFSGVLVLPLIIMAWRKNSLSRALYSLVSWTLNAAGLLCGMLASQRPVNESIASRIIREPEAMAQPSVGLRS